MYLYMYCEIYVVGNAGVSDGGHSGGNGDVTVNDDTNLNTVMLMWMTVVMVILL